MRSNPSYLPAKRRRRHARYIPTFGEFLAVCGLASAILGVILGVALSC